MSALDRIHKIAKDHGWAVRGDEYTKGNRAITIRAVQYGTGVHATVYRPQVGTEPVAVDYSTSKVTWILKELAK